MAGCAGLRHESVVAALAVVNRCAQHHVMVLAHRGIASCGSPETGIVTELTAVYSRDISRSPVTETTGDIRRDLRPMVFLHAHITGGVAAITAAIKVHCRVTAIAVNAWIHVERMMSVTRGQLVVVSVNTPAISIVTGHTTRHITSVTMTCITGKIRISNSHVVVLLLVCLAGSMTVLTV